MRLRVALIIDKFGPKMGGAERYAYDLALRLIREGHEVHVFCRKGETADPQVHLHRVPCVPYPKSLRLLTFVNRTRRMIAADTFDIVHGLGYNPDVTVLGPHTGIEESWIEGDDRSYESGARRAWAALVRRISPRGYLIRRLQRRQYRDPGVRAVVAISDMVGGDMIRYHDVAPGRIEVIYNGVDTKRFSPKNRDVHREGTRQRLGLGPGEILILMVTNNFRLKGVGPAIRALPYLDRMVDRPFRLYVVGRGNPRMYLGEARRLGVEGRVLFSDYVEDLLPLYSAADIFLHPTFFYDSCALVILEAMASGLPVVTTDKNGAAGLIASREIGEAVDDPRDAPRLAEALARYFPDRARKAAMNEAVRILPDLSDERSFGLVLGVYRRVAAAGGGTGARRLREGTRRSVE